MCIIAAKPKGVKMPDNATLFNMWSNNSDGAGFMYAKNGQVHISKGYMKYKDFMAALEELKKTVDLNAASVVLHFRIATHGGVNRENTHPFPITDSIGKLKKLQQTAKIGVAHNGVIRVTPRKGISDTMEYIAGQLAPLAKGVPKFYENPHLMEMISHAADSKLAFMDSAGEIYTVGDFHAEADVLYSNFTYSYDNSWRSAKITYFNSADAAWKTTSAKAYSDTYWDPDAEDYDLDDDGALLDFSGGFVYEQRNLMYLDDSKGDYVRTDKGLLDVGDYLMDEDGLVYLYDYDLDACIPTPGYTAFTSQGTPLRFNEERAFDELVAYYQDETLPV